LILSLFSGYGGLDLAVQEITGLEVGWVCEVKEPAVRILEERFPGAFNVGDISEIHSWKPFKKHVSVITAGFPCQDISDAGTRKGIEGDRSSLWKHVAEATRVIRPELLFLENVAALLGRGADTVAADLAEIRYDLVWRTLRASDVGALHERNRWFGIAFPSDADVPRWDVRPRYIPAQAGRGES